MLRGAGMRDGMTSPSSASRRSSSVCASSASADSDLSTIAASVSMIFCVGPGAGVFGRSGDTTVVVVVVPVAGTGVVGTVAMVAPWLQTSIVGGGSAGASFDARLMEGVVVPALGVVVPSLGVVVVGAAGVAPAAGFSSGLGLVAGAASTLPPFCAA